MKKLQLIYTIECDESLLESEEVNEENTLKFGEEVNQVLKEKYRDNLKEFKVEYKEIEDGNK
jgi:hypothetical protein